jgi:hypothetical protein
VFVKIVKILTLFFWYYVIKYPKILTIFIFLKKFFFWFILIKRIFFFVLLQWWCCYILVLTQVSLRGINLFIFNFHIHYITFLILSFWFFYFIILLSLGKIIHYNVFINFVIIISLLLLFGKIISSLILDPWGSILLNNSILYLIKK